MNPPFGVSNRALSRYRAIRRIPLEVSSNELRSQILGTAEAALRNGDLEDPPPWWSGECEYLLRARGRGPEVFLVVRKDEATGQLVIVTVHSYDDMARFENRQGQAVATTVEGGTLSPRRLRRNPPGQQPDGEISRNEGDESSSTPTLSTAVANLDADWLQALVDGRLHEGRQIEFKEQLPSGSDKDKREFLADVSSFANAAGGDLVYGLRERRDPEGRPTGEADAVIGLPGVNLDAERLRLESTIRAGIAPRLAVQFYDIKREPEPPCLLVRVPRSWSGLHMVTFKSWSRFFGRSSAGKYELDVHDIGRGFLTRGTAQDRVAAFRADRMSRIVGGGAPIRLSDEPKVLVHAIPLDPNVESWVTLQTRAADSVARAFATALQNLLVGSVVMGFDWTAMFNLDGLLVRTNLSSAKNDSYLQLFRHGAIEAVAVGVVDARRFNGQPVFSGSATEGSVIALVRGFQRAWRELTIVGPIVIGLTLLGLRGAGMVRDDNRAPGLPKAPLDQDPLVLPETVVDDVDTAPETMLRPIFDVLWNAGGLPRSPNYQADGWSRH